MQITPTSSVYKTAFAMQHSGPSEAGALRTLEALQPFTSYSFGLMTHSTEVMGVESIPEEPTIIALGSTKMVELYHCGFLPDNWVVFHDLKTFSQEYYAPLLGKELVNASDTQYITLGEALNHGKFSDTMFIKPSDDLKMFAGTLVNKGHSLQEALDEMQHQPLDLNATVVVAPFQMLHREFRVIVIGGVAFGFSQYKDSDQRVIGKACTQGERDALYFKTKYINKHFRPADVYTIDYAEVGPDKKLKVVEYNCFNCSGMYKIDQRAVYHYLAQYMDAKQRKVQNELQSKRR